MATLPQVGLTKEAELVYRAMLVEPSWGVNDLATHLGMSERAIRTALDKLAELALLRRTGADGPWLPVNPNEGFDRLVADAEREIQQRQNEIAATRGVIAAIAAELDERRNCGDTVRMENVELVRARLMELAGQVRTECLSFSPGGAHGPDAMAASRPLNEDALRRGVQLRCVYQDAFRNDPDTLAYTQWLTGLGGLVRTVPAVPMQLVIVDRAVAILPINPTAPRAGAVEVRNMSVIAAICALFENIWSSATPLGTTTDVDDEGLSPHEREVLRLLAEGHTDDSLARRLGVSVRTVRRTVADLIDRLQAASRFQAGAHAARRGWI